MRRGRGLGCVCKSSETVKMIMTERGASGSVALAGCGILALAGEVETHRDNDLGCQISAGIMLCLSPLQMAHRMVLSHGRDHFCQTETSSKLQLLASWAARGSTARCNLCASPSPLRLIIDF